jgi:predicted CoA-binding protein/signal transduction histidine kinase
MPTYDFLRKVPLFANLPEADLERICEIVEEVRLGAGQELFAEGSPGDKAYVIQEGELEIIKTSGERPVLLALRRSGEVIGEIALLEDEPRMASVRARGPAVLLAISQEQFNQLLNTSPSAVRTIMNTVLNRWRNVTAALRQSEKMAQVGTLTAGVAHELNNPAAAVKSGSTQLLDAIQDYGLARERLAGLGLAAEQQHALEALEGKVRSLAARPPDLDALTRSDREAELEAWLDEQDIPEAWEMAPALVSLEFDAGRLAGLAQRFGLEPLPDVIAWLCATYAVHNLLAEIGQGATRISEIVKALKSYAYLDQAPVQAVDVHQGLDDTLLMLRSKLRDKVSVRREYDPNLPNIFAFGSELNQVWTNIIDNAADALDGQADAQITIRTRSEGPWIIVDIADNGPGIPLEIQHRIFDTFFTTKPPGVGTGLGLDISYNIVVHKHKGDLRVFSQPGLTCFTTYLPINPGTVEASPPPSLPGDPASDEQIRRILETSKTIAVVGISARPGLPAHEVPAYLQQHGYRIIPVNPHLDQVLGEKAYPDLLSVPEPVDVVQIFRRSERVLPHVEEAIRIGAKVVWMQEGISNEHAAQVAQAAGLEVVTSNCMMTSHARLFNS